MVPHLELDNTSEAAMTALINQARADVNLAKSACDAANDLSGKLIRALFEQMPAMGE